MLNILDWIFNKGQVIGVIIGFGLAFFTLYQIIRPKLKKIDNFDKRIIFLEVNMKWIIKVCDRRKFNMPVKVERRKNGCNF